MHIQKDSLGVPFPITQAFAQGGLCAHTAQALATGWYPLQSLTPDLTVFPCGRCYHRTTNLVKKSGMVITPTASVISLNSQNIYPIAIPVKKSI